MFEHTHRYIHLTKHEWGVELPCALCVGPFVSANSFVNRKFGSHGTEEGGGAAFLWLRPDQCMGEKGGGQDIWTLLTFCLFSKLRIFGFGTYFRLPKSSLLHSKVNKKTIFLGLAMK